MVNGDGHIHVLRMPASGGEIGDGASERDSSSESLGSLLGVLWGQSGCWLGAQPWAAGWSPSGPFPCACVLSQVLTLAGRAQPLLGEAKGKPKLDSGKMKALWAGEAVRVEGWLQWDTDPVGSWVIL